MARRPDVRTLLRVTPGVPVDLSAIDPRSTPGLPAVSDPKRWSREQYAQLGAELAGQQERLYASAKSGADRRRVLVVLQAMDSGGKDGTIKHLARLMDPQGLRIVGFGVPTRREQEHDFLWRIRRSLPQPGYVGVFNRSHYEDVLVARVRELVHPRTWRRRYDTINRFERELVDDGVVLVKVMLHISFEEQRHRLTRRLTDPSRYWKYSPRDVDERGLWPAYQEAYAEALERCSTEWAP